MTRHLALILATMLLTACSGGIQSQPIQYPNKISSHPDANTIELLRRELHTTRENARQGSCPWYDKIDWEVRLQKVF